MRVCHIWHNFYPIEFGGIERYILSLSDFLSVQDANMHFLMITDKAAYVPFRCALRIASYQRINSLEVHRLGPNFSSLLRSAYFKILNRKSKLLDNLLLANLYRNAIHVKEIDEVDIFHVHGFWQPLYANIGLMLSQHYHRPLVITLHGDSVNPKNQLAMPLRSPEMLNVLRSADIITTHFKETRNELQKLGLGRKSRLVPNFVDAKLFKRSGSSRIVSGNRILMVSRLTQSKDPITPIRAFAKVRNELPDATLRIVGYGPLYEYANRMVKDLKLEGSVTFYGARSDVRKFLWDSDIFIGTRGSYLATLEAWAAGLAVVAPDFGIMKEIISNGENGLLSPVGSANELASDLISLIKNKKLRSKIIAKGTQAVEKHDIRNVAPFISNIYKALQ